MLATLLWPLDIAARRLQLPEHWWEKAAAIFRRRGQSQAQAVPSASATVFSDLTAKKERLQQKRGRSVAEETAASGLFSSSTSPAPDLGQSKSDRKEAAQGARNLATGGKVSTNDSPAAKALARENPAAKTPASDKPSAGGKSSQAPASEGKSDAFSRLLDAKKRNQK